MADNIYSIKKGEKFLIHVKVRNRDMDEPIDLSNAVIKIEVKDELKDEFNIIDRTITTETDAYEEGRILDPKNGEFVFMFSDSDYENLVAERIYYLIIWWTVPEENFAKVISSNCNQVLKLKVCNP